MTTGGLVPLCARYAELDRLSPAHLERGVIIGREWGVSVVGPVSMLKHGGAVGDYGYVSRWVSGENGGGTRDERVSSEGTSILRMPGVSGSQS